MVEEFEEGYNGDLTDSGGHYEQPKSVQDKFVKGVHSLVATFEEAGNPFMEKSGNSLNLKCNVTLKLPKSVTWIMCRTSYQSD